MKFIKFCLLLLCSTYLISCGQISTINESINNNYGALDVNNSGKLAEVATPKTIRQLNQKLEKYSPQVEIISPQANQTFKETNIDVQLKVEDLPIFKDDKLKLGNHLNLILDNEPAKQIYSVVDPIAIGNLTPGTHTIRVFATRPWGESFKNDDAYAQTTFNVLTETTANYPDPSLPLLTYNNPTGIYGAEPFLLDFYLTNAPLHEVANNDSNLEDWQIKVTVNGDSFLLEDWKPVYLTGLNKGENWIQLELLDREDNNIENAFNNTVRVINYDPQQTDTLSKLLTNKISLAEGQPIVEQSYYIQPVGEPEIIEPAMEDISEEAESTVIDETIEPQNDKTNEVDADVQPVIRDEQDEISESDSAITNPVSEVNQENSINLTAEQDIEKNTIDEIDEAPVTITTEEVQPTESKEEPEEVITITQENANSSEPVAEIEIPQPESVEIKDDEIAVNLPQNEADIADEENIETPVWWKKILVGLRQKLEKLVKLLPSEA